VLPLPDARLAPNTPAAAIVHPGWLIGLYKIPLKDEMETPEWVVAQTVLQFWGIWIALGLGVCSAEGESVIKYKSPLNVLTDTYDHSCY
jgi:hypothetical protein